MSHKKVSAQVWSDLYPDQPPRPGLIILDAPAKGGGGHQYISCGGDEPKNLEKRARKLAALWNMAERLGLSTEEIESGNVETKLKTAHDMLEALEGVKRLIECYVSDLEHSEEYQEVVRAIRKARGEE